MNYELDFSFVSGTLHLPESTPLSVVRAADCHLEDALQQPLGLPALPDCVVPGDRVVFAVNPGTPDCIAVLTAAWEQLHSKDVKLNVTVIFPPDPSGNGWAPLIDQLPVHLRSQTVVRIHDAGDEEQRSYLASSASGERIYLADCVVDADLLVTITYGAFDPMFGWLSPVQSVFPALADLDMIRRTYQPQTAFPDPIQHRTFRELATEVSWLLGTQFAIHIIPDSAGKALKALVGAPDAVEEASQQVLHDHWKFVNDEERDLVIVTLPASPDAVAWQQFAVALLNARRMVDQDGRIVVIGELPVPESPALRILHRSRDRRELMKPLTEDPTFDAGAAVSLIQALEKATVFLMCDLPEGLADELGCESLTTLAELQRLIDESESCALAAGASYAYVTDPSRRITRA